MIRSGITYSFKKELLQGIHDFENDMFGMALYRSSANLSAATTTAYVEAGEVSAPGYDAGGVVVDCQIVPKPEGSVDVQFKDVEWAADLMNVRGAMIFNVTKDMRSVAILDFSLDRSSLDGVFKVRFPNGTEKALTYSLLTIA